jgi:cell division protein FtsB
MRVAVDRSTFEELRRLQAENAALKAENTALKAETRMLRAREGREPRRA